MHVAHRTDIIISIIVIDRVLYTLFFFFNDTATTEIYTLSLHDALPIYADRRRRGVVEDGDRHRRGRGRVARDRKSTRLNSSHDQISYAVFCLKKKKTTTYDILNHNDQRPVHEADSRHDDLERHEHQPVA